jgi:hypothetical protein
MLEGLAPKQPRNSCKVTETINTLEPADQGVLTDALKDPRWTAASLSKALRTRGLILGKDTMKLHQNEECACYRI